MVTIVYVGYNLRPTIAKAIKWIKENLVENLVFQYFNTSEVDRGLVKPENYIEALRNADVVLLDIRGGDNIYKYTLEGIRNTKAKAVVVFVGGSPEIMSWTRLGYFTLKKLKDKMGGQVDYGTIVRIRDMFEKIGRVLPVSILRDARNYVWILRYYENPTYRNMVNMLILLLKEYVGLNIDYKVEKPETLPPMGIIDLHANKIYDDPREYLENYRFHDKPLIGILFYGGYHHEESIVAARAIAKKIEERGFGVIPVFSGDLRYYIAINKYFLHKGEPLVDVVIDLLWFRFAGGPLGGDHRKTLAVLKMLDRPFLHGIYLSTYTIDEWLEKNRIPPVETITTVILPELDGRFEPIVTHGRRRKPYNGYYVDVFEAVGDRVEKISNRAVKWAMLRRKPNSEKKIAIIIYAYPPGIENLGKCSYLDVFASLEKILERLKQEGYDIPRVPDRNELKQLITRAYLAHVEKKELPGAIIVDKNTYLKLYEEIPVENRREVNSFWGDPGKSIDKIILPGVILGKVFIGVQPSRGKHENPEKTYHSREIPPTHEYIAFYKWIEKIFEADAVIHLGTHGTLEFLPGKEVGLTRNCYPDILIGDLPNIYVYTVINPSESSIAKRRSYALIINHATPPYMHGELPEEIGFIERLLSQYYETLQYDPGKASVIEKEIIEKASKLGLGGSIDEIHDRINEYRRTPLPRGLHVLGEKLSREHLLEYLLVISRYDRGEAKSLYRLIAEAEGFNYEKLLEGRGEYGKLYSYVEEKTRSLIFKYFFRREPLDKILDELELKNIDRNILSKTLEYLKQVIERVNSSNELDSLIHALEAGYIEPGPGGDPVRNPEVYPTGRNMYQLDPSNIPTSIAWERGRRIAEEIIERYRREKGEYPRMVSFVLWAFETMKTGGETLAAIFHLLGVKPVWKTPYIRDLEVIPLEKLGRPRIDVVVTICGIFRDTFYNLVELLDKAFKKVAELDEPLDKNYVKAHMVELRQHSVNRIFGPPPDKYATELTTMIEEGSWRSESELIQAYLESMRYVYSEKEYGVEAYKLFEKLLGKTNVVAQVRDTIEYEVTDLDHYYEFLGGLARTVSELRGDKPLILVADTTREKVKVEDIRDAIRRGVVTRITNPSWIKELLKHDHHGGEKIATRVENLLGLAALTHSVENWAWDRIAEKLVFDEETRRMITENNPWAMSKIIDKLVEAYERGYWKTDEEKISKLKEIKKETMKYIDDLRKTIVKE